MTFQPPPGNQPPPGSPPPPPPGQWGPPPGGGSGAGGSGGFDPKSINPLDWGIIAAGALAFIFSLFDYYTVTVSGGGFSSSASESAWNGFFGWFAAVLAVVGAGLVAAQLFAPQTKLPVPARLAGLGAFALSLVCVILALFVFPEDVPDTSGIDTGHGFGYWASLIVIIAGLVLSLMRFQATGGQLPGGLQSKVPNVGGYGPQGGISGGSAAPQPGYGQQPPPPPGYAPPQPPPGYGQQPPPPPPGYGPPQ
ncbi:hypothetical protein [uncultured Jatrophihabitans sp.]|uniref:hypothetical protein n=1 Tax=uncultured Jatrophihabitans sp. TaxID=1610747 RepID=UPI0035CA6EC5